MFIHEVFEGQKVRLNVHVYYKIVYNNKKLESTWIAISRRMFKELTVSIHKISCGH